MANELMAPNTNPDQIQTRGPAQLETRSTEMAAVMVPPPARFNAAMAKAQSEFKPVPKTKTAMVKSDKGNFTYKYADLADILEMALPIMARNGLSVRQPLRRLGTLMVLVTEIHHESGEWVCDDGIPIPTNLSPQGFGSHLTYMRRYGLCNMTAIAPDADEDGQLAAADKKEQEELRAAQRRNAAATGTALPPVQDAGPREAVIRPGEPVWTDEQRVEFNRAWKKGGHVKADALKYMNEVLGVRDLKLAHAAQHSAAMAWAETGPPKAAEPVKAASEVAQTKPPTIDHTMKATFWDTARKAGKTDGEIGRYLDNVLKIKSTAEMLIARYTEALKWAATRDDRPEQTDAEKRARQGMSILDLDLAEQSEIFDAHNGDWELIAASVSAEISRRDETQP